MSELSKISVLLSSIQPIVAIGVSLFAAGELLVKKPGMQSAITKARRNSKNRLSCGVDPTGFHQPENMRQSEKAGVFFMCARISLKFGSVRATPAFSPLISAITNHLRVGKRPHIFRGSQQFVHRDRA